MNEELKKRLLQTFKLEAKEHLQNIRNGLLQLEELKEREEKLSLLEEIYRDAHSLKGAARAVNLTDIVDLCQNVENIFSALKKEEIKESEELFDLAQNALGVIENFIEEEDENARILMYDDIQQYQVMIEDFLEKAEKPGEAKNAEDKTSQTEIVEKAKPEEAEKKESPVASKPLKPKSVKPKRKAVKEIKKIDTVRVAISKLENILIATEEMIPLKIAFSKVARELASMLFMIDTWKSEWTRSKLDFVLLRGNIEKYASDIGNVEEIKKMIDFVEFNEEFANDFYGFLSDVQRLQASSARQLNNILFNLDSGIKEVLMLPFSILTDQFPTMLRDIAHELGKKIEFNVSGVTVEIDKRILEELKDPLVHLLRNAIDHGIEYPEERLKLGKNEKGKISIEFLQTGEGRVEIIISDDGRGMDAEEVKATAVEKGLISPDEAEKLSESEKLALIFKSDFSTAKVVTELSGRGLGMAIVKEKIDKLGGKIRIETEKGKGSKFILSIPLVLATIRGLIIESGGQPFALNIAKIHSVINRRVNDIKTVENKETVEFAGKRLAIVSLAELLGLPFKIPEEGNLTIVVIKFADEILGVVIDEIIDEQEILIKPLSAQFKKTVFIEGATISPEGEIIPLINVNDIFNAAKGSKGFGKLASKEEKAEKKKILVVDDSVTSRVLLSDILSSVGYDVTAKNDGKEAWAELNSNNYDLVVTDVEMPRMDGFELTRNIRNSSKFSELPVVLVTGLSKREHKEKGIEVGANAYIVKSDFEQETLLDVIKKMI